MRVPCPPETLSMLIDAVMFANLKEEDVNLIFQIMNLLEKVTSMKINISKSMVAPK